MPHMYYLEKSIWDTQWDLETHLQLVRITLCLFIFRGNTEQLIPLYTMFFIPFALSQTGDGYPLDS